MPPQHGKSEGSSRRLPSYMLGKDPELKIALCSYSATFARKFNRVVQRIIDTKEYRKIFPMTKLNRSRVAYTAEGNYLRNTEEFEIVDHGGSFKAVGRGGPLTGDKVDFADLDDLYKDYAEGNSPVVRAAVIDWYESVVTTRLHNNSKQLIVFTRWNAGDLVGYLSGKETIIPIEDLRQLDSPEEDAWYKINFEAIKTGPPSIIDPRKAGEALWPEMHRLKDLERARERDPEKFGSLYQGDPRPLEGLLYSHFSTYTEIPKFKKLSFYVDTADTGKDFLCAIIYGVGLDGVVYVLEVYYTQEPQEITEPELAQILIKWKVKEGDVESNNGGRGFARAVDRLTKGKIVINWFFQGGNKESRILTNSPAVQRNILFPINWVSRWPEFATALLYFKRLFRANDHDDAPDCLTGVYEHSGVAEYDPKLLYSW